MRIRFAIAAALVAAAAPAPLAAQGRASIVTTEWLAQHLADASVAVLHMTRDTADYRAGHVPGAREIRYPWITVMRDSIGTELPPADSLRAIFERLGVSDDSHVVLYASGSGMAPMASRAFLSLDYLGHQNVSLLSGGLARWRAEGRPVATDVVVVRPGRITTQPRDVVVNATWVQARAGKPGIAVLDTRTPAEYLGTGEGSGPRSEGHIAGAKPIEWQQLFASADSGLFLPTDAIARLYRERSAAGDTIVTYCTVGYRASMTYFGARVLGLPVRIYDGSYQDWTRRKLAVTKGDTP